MRRLAVGSLLSSLVAVLVACGPKGEPKQASSPDPIEESSDSSGSSSPSSSSGSHASRSGPDLSPPPGAAKPTAKASKGEATAVASVASFQEGLRWGMSHADVTKMFTENGGIIWKDFDERLAKARVGPEMTALEAEREQAKGAFARSYIEFKDTPTGYDATPIKGEYTYKNKESLMWVQRQGKKRYFFFINDRLWKVYDEVPLSDSGVLGAGYADAVSAVGAQLGAEGRKQAPDAAKGIMAPTTDWKDGSSHLRLVDRSSEHLVGLVVEDSSTLGNLAQLRSNKAEDPTAIDPSIAAVTKGTNRTDPNAVGAPSASAKPTQKPPKKK